MQTTFSFKAHISQKNIFSQFWCHDKKVISVPHVHAMKNLGYAKFKSCLKHIGFCYVETLQQWSQLIYFPELKANQTFLINHSTKTTQLYHHLSTFQTFFLSKFKFKSQKTLVYWRYIGTNFSIHFFRKIHVVGSILIKIRTSAFFCFVRKVKLGPKTAGKHEVFFKVAVFWNTH